jgi:hypothetical protein
LYRRKRRQIDAAPPDRTLKGLLLNLSTLPSVQNGSRAELAPNAVPALTAGGTPETGGRETAGIPSRNKTGLAERLNDLYRDLVQMIRREAPSLDAQLIAPAAGNRPLPALLITAPQQQPAAPVMTEPVSAPLLVNIAGRIAELLASAGTIDVPRTAPSEPMPSEVPTPQREITALLKQLAEISDSLTRTVSGLPAPSAQMSIVPLIRSALDTLEALTALLRNLPETGAAVAEKTVPDRDRAAINQPQERPALPIPAAQLQNLFSRAIDTALDRLESLQLLARQTSTAQGTQQIIALPIKFGEAWTEINVRFLRHRQRKSSTGNPHYSVTIDVAPAALGAISAHLDYRISGQLQVGLEFERPSTRDWFTAHRDELQSGLTRDGAVAVRLDLRQKRKHVSSSTTALRNDSGTIDMTV